MPQHRLIVVLRHCSLKRWLRSVQLNELVFYKLIYIKSFDTKWRHKVGSKENVEACAPGGGAGGAGWSDTMKLKVKGTEYGTVAQYINALQREQFFAIVAGVAIQQHTRMLMADLHMRADGMSVADVHAGLRQLAAELDASTLRTR